jgi:hypothetical protein
MRLRQQSPGDIHSPHSGKKHARDQMRCAPLRAEAPQQSQLMQQLVRCFSALVQKQRMLLTVRLSSIPRQLRIQ